MGFENIVLLVPDNVSKNRRDSQRPTCMKHLFICIALRMFCPTLVFIPTWSMYVVLAKIVGRPPGPFSSCLLPSPFFRQMGVESRYNNFSVHGLPM